MKRRVENGNLGRVGQYFFGRDNTNQVRRIMQWRQIGQFVNGFYHFVGGGHAAREFITAVNDAVTDPADFRQRNSIFRQQFDNRRQCRGMVFHFDVFLAAIGVGFKCDVGPIFADFFGITLEHGLISLGVKNLKF